MGSRGQSRKRQLAQLDRASEKYNNLQERADSINGIGGRFYDRNGREVPREEVEKLDEDLKKARERFEELRDRMIEREERRNAGRQQEQSRTIDDDMLFSEFAEQDAAKTAAEKAAARAAKRQATREKRAKNARMTAGEWIKNQVNVDIEKYRDSATKQFDMRGFITINWKNMPRTERAYIEQLAQKYPNRIQLFDAGAWAKQIKFNQVKPSKTPTGVRVTFQDGTQRYYTQGPDGMVADQYGYPVSLARGMKYNQLIKQIKSNQSASGVKIEKVSGKELKAIRDAYREEQRNKPDYEMGIGTPWGNKDNRRAARQSRLAGRIAKYNR